MLEPDCFLRYRISGATRNFMSGKSHVYVLPARRCSEAWFLTRVSHTLTLTRDIDIGILSVRPSVRNAPVSDENGLTYCHSFFTVP